MSSIHTRSTWRAAPPLLQGKQRDQQHRNLIDIDTLPTAAADGPPRRHFGSTRQRSRAELTAQAIARAPHKPSPNDSQRAAPIHKVRPPTGRFPVRSVADTDELSKILSSTAGSHKTPTRYRRQPSRQTILGAPPAPLVRKGRNAIPPSQDLAFVKQEHDRPSPRPERLLHDRPQADQQHRSPRTIKLTASRKKPPPPTRSTVVSSSKGASKEQPSSHSAHPSHTVKSYASGAGGTTSHASYYRGSHAIPAPLAPPPPQPIHHTPPKPTQENSHDRRTSIGSARRKSSASLPSMAAAGMFPKIIA